MITIIIPTFNRRELLLSALNSVVEQDYRPIEIIVVDDGSSDDTSKSVSVWATNIEKLDGINFIYLQQQNRGPGAARNNGLRKASGDFILFLDSDDMLKENALKLLSYYVTDTNAVVGGAIEVGNSAIAWSRLFLPVTNTGLSAVDDFIRGGLSINCGCWLVSASLARSVQPFLEDMFIAEDSLYFLGIIMKSSNVVRLREPVLMLRAHNNGRLTDLDGSLHAMIAQARYLVECADLMLENANIVATDTKNHIAKECLKYSLRLWSSNRDLSDRLILAARKLDMNVTPEYKSLVGRVLWQLGGIQGVRIAYFLKRYIDQMFGR